MEYPEDVAAAADYLKKTIPHMVKHDTPANPINYTLWYNYVANKIPALNTELDAITASALGLTPEQSKTLFFNYIINDYFKDHQETLKGITQLATRLISHFNTSIEDNQAYDAEIAQSIEQLKQAATMDEVIAAIDSVINTSKRIRTANSSFASSLKAANKEINALRQELQLVERHAYIDQLTQLYNRHAFDRQLGQLIGSGVISSKLFLILVDLDNFKLFNDSYGHVIGDRVLQRMGELIQDNCPNNAIGARYGGEEFAVIVNNSSLEDTVALAELLRKKTQQLTVKVRNSDKTLSNITASFGITQYILGENTESFVDRADTALYRAKNNGRNSIETN